MMSPYFRNSNARVKAVPDSITDRGQASARWMASGKSLPTTGNAIESSKRPAMVVGATLSGKCRSTGC